MTTPPPPFLIANFVLVADHYEDRLRLDAVDASGAGQSVFLTRRLLDRFVPLLVRHSERQATPQAEGQGPRAALTRSLVLSHRQASARLARRTTPQQPVAITPAAAPWLCTGMVLQARKAGAQWIMKGREGQDARFYLSFANLVGMLDVTLAKYRALEWEDAAFPDWVRENAEKPGKPRAVLH